MRIVPGGSHILFPEERGQLFFAAGNYRETGTSRSIRNHPVTKIMGRCGPVKRDMPRRGESQTRPYPSLSLTTT